jgi:YHS domain-containing protein
VDIKKEVNGKYRVIIRYTDLSIGEYRRAHIDYHAKDKLKAIKDFQALARGADFYFGSSPKAIRFQDKPSKLKPF